MVRLSAKLRFPESIKQVEVRAVELGRTIAPVDVVWGNFLLSLNLASDQILCCSLVEG